MQENNGLQVIGTVNSICQRSRDEEVIATLQEPPHRESPNSGSTTPIIGTFTLQPKPASAP
jgi:hypothetical protein